MERFPFSFVWCFKCCLSRCLAQQATTFASLSMKRCSSARACSWRRALAQQATMKCSVTYVETPHDEERSGACAATNAYANHSCCVPNIYCTLDGVLTDCEATSSLSQCLAQQSTTFASLPVGLCSSARACSWRGALLQHSRTKRSPCHVMTSDAMERGGACVPTYLTVDSPPKIYCTVDGVLADFESACKHRLGTSMKDEGCVRDGEAFFTTLGYQSLFYDAPWTRDGKLLWSLLKHHEPIIVTRDDDLEQRRQWCRTNLESYESKSSYDSKVIIPERGSILIDEAVTDARQWMRAGGIFIYHYNAKQTISELEAILRTSPLDLQRCFICENHPVASFCRTCERMVCVSCSADFSDHHCKRRDESGL